MNWYDFLVIMKNVDWVPNILMLFSVLITGTFSWLVWRVSKTTADIAKATFELVKQNEEKSAIIFNNEKKIYTSQSLRTIDKFSRFLIKEDIYSYMVEIRKGVPFEYELLSRYYNIEFGLKLLSIWDQLSSYSDLYIFTEFGENWSIVLKHHDIDIVEKREELINSIQLFLREAQGADI